MPSGRDEMARGAAALAAFRDEPDPVRALDVWFGGPAGIGGGDLRRRLIAVDVARIDELVSAQLDAVLHHPRLKTLEASWRGLAYLVDQAEGYRESEGAAIKIRVLTIGWSELVRDIERAIEFDQSQMFKKIYEAEFGAAGGEPYGLLLGDFEFSHRARPGHPAGDIGILEGMARIGAAAFAPFVGACHPSLFGLDVFGDLEMLLEVGRTFDLAEYTKWTAFRRTDDSRFAALVLPRVLARLPWADDGSRADGFRYREEVSTPGGADYLWGTGVFAFGSVVVRAVGEVAWPADIRGIPQEGLGGGLVTDLPVVAPGPGSGDIAFSFSTDVLVTDRLEKELSDLGFMAICPVRGTPWAAFYGTPSAQAAKKYDTAGATINAKLSSMLQYILCVSRFAHFVKAMGRDKIGSFATAQQCQRELHEWLMTFTTGNDDASPAMKARYPLREARVEVREHPGKPGAFVCVVHLKPHYQLDQVAAAVKLVTEFAPVRAG